MLNSTSSGESPSPIKHNPFSRFMNSLSSYDTNIMLAAVISLLLVILFVLLLHVYAKWFLAQARQRRRSSSVSVSHVLRPTRLHNFQVETNFPSSPSRGLDKSVISSIPSFIYKPEDHKKQGSLDCVICLSVFEENEIGRKLVNCGHSFHVECIDMWLCSHTNCPTCRAQAVCDIESDSNAKCVEVSNIGESTESQLQSRLEIVVDVSVNSENENNESLSGPSSPSSPSSSLSACSSLGCSLKRMLSRSRSETRKVFPSSNVAELDA